MDDCLAPIAYLNRLICESRPTEDGGSRWHRYSEAIPELSANLPAPILGLMVLVWQLRERDLQQLYPLTSWESRIDFLAWCVVHGRREYSAFRSDAPLLWDALRMPSPPMALALQPGDDRHGISALMLLIRRARTDLQMDLTTLAGRDEFLLWFLMHGRKEMGLLDLPLPDWQVQYCIAPSDQTGLNHIQKLIYDSRPDVRNAFHLPQALPQYLAWFEELHLLQGELCAGAYPAPYDQAPAASGVNVVGYAYGQLGIGEDARMAANALLAANVPVTMLNFPPGGDVSQEDISMEAYVGSHPKYKTNIFCLTALEQARYLAERGFSCLRHRHNIGYWPWELAEWPNAWRHLFSIVDEVWVSTQHTFDAVANASFVPVRHMPMAVAPLPVGTWTRHDFGLPERTTLFLFAFDLKSSLGRKNPAACVEAFLRAFPMADSTTPDDVGLVIKVHPPKGQNDAWDQLKQLQHRDPRIHLIEETLSKERLLALYQCCDIFISLHRAEGFGRCIAEVMLLGKPVIVTGYSGNMDFTNTKNAMLVNYDLISLEDGVYPHGEGQVWAEPDINDAAAKMRKVVGMPELAAALGARGRVVIEELHSLKRVGMHYANMLNDIKISSRFITDAKC